MTKLNGFTVWDEEYDAQHFTLLQYRRTVIDGSVPCERKSQHCDDIKTGTVLDQFFR